MFRLRPFFILKQSEFFMVTDFTKGNVGAALISFAFPLFLANVLQSLYSVADMMIVGRLVGSAGLAGVDNAARICFLVTSLAGGVTTGGAVLVAQMKGAGDERGVRESVGTLLSLSAIASLILTVVCLAVGETVMRAMRVPEGAMQYALDYFRILSLGTVFVFGYNAVSAIMRGLGDSKSPLVFVAVSVVLNVGLDLAFIGPLHLGTAGAALATVLSEAVSFAIALARLKRGGYPFDFRLRSFRPIPRLTRAILKTGIPSALQMAVLNLSYLLVNGMQNGFGVEVAAASGIGIKVNTIAVMPCWAIGQAVTTMCAQNIGAGDFVRVKKTARAGIAAAVAVSAVTMIAVQIWMKPLVGLFNTDPAVVALGCRYLRICCSANLFAYAAMFVLDSLATGAGDTVFAMANSLVHSVAMRLSFSALFCFAFGMGYEGIWWGESLSPIVPCAVAFAYYLSGIWKKRRLF
jgi:putative MATE family efflux protein